MSQTGARAELSHIIVLDVNDMHHPETGVLQCYNVRCTHYMIFPPTYGCLAITMSNEQHRAG